MFGGSLATWVRNWRSSFEADLSTAENRRRAATYIRWFDHGILRGVWHNFHRVAPEVYRSNYPSPKRLARMKARGIRTIINLRGDGAHIPYVIEREACDALGLTLESVALNSRRAPPREALVELITLMRRVERPFLMHCKSGADRVGLASAIYMIAVENRPVAEARKMLSWRFIHFSWLETGVLDLLIDRYAARQAETGIGFEEWLGTEYDPVQLQSDYDAGRR